MYRVCDCISINHRTPKLFLGVGFTLRKDDPVSLKDIILKMQQKANDANLDTYKDK